jgi:hypothetical protein
MAAAVAAVALSSAERLSPTVRIYILTRPQNRCDRAPTSEVCGSVSGERPDGTIFGGIGVIVAIAVALWQIG